MSAFVASDPSSPGYYKPEQTALLLLDFHAMFVEKLGGPAAQAALEKAADLRDWATEKGMIAIHCLIDAELEPHVHFKGTERLKGFVAMMKQAGTDEAALLKSDTEANFFRRPGYISALSSPGLNEFLKEKGIKSLLMTGLSSSGCVMRTTIPATDADYVATVISDGCADSDQEVHDMVMTKLLTNRAHVVTAQEFKDEYEKMGH